MLSVQTCTRACVGSNRGRRGDRRRLWLTSEFGITKFMVCLRRRLGRYWIGREERCDTAFDHRNRSSAHRTWAWARSLMVDFGNKISLQYMFRRTKHRRAVGGYSSHHYTVFRRVAHNVAAFADATRNHELLDFTPEENQFLSEGGTPLPQVFQFSPS